jgi:choline-glycine betaine transporter
MRVLFRAFSLILAGFGVVCLGYAVLLPFLHGMPADTTSAAAVAVYQKGTYYGILAVGLFSLAGLVVAYSGNLRRP